MRMNGMVEVQGNWWKGGNKIRFDFNTFNVFDYKNLKGVLNKNEGALLTLNNTITLKKEAGAWNFFIKTSKKGFKRLKANNIKKVIERLKNK